MDYTTSRPHNQERRYAMEKEQELTFEHIKDRLDNDPLCLEFMKLVMELDNTERMILLFGLRTGDIKGTERELKRYAQQKKARLTDVK